MAKLIYSALTSFNGYIADESGSFDWAAPDEEVHAFVNELERPVGTYLYGRAMYEVMTVWETMEREPELPDVMRDYARIWKAADKIVYSRTLTSVPTGRTRLVNSFDAATVRELKEAATRDIAVGGSALAGQVIAAGLVDEWHFLLNPVIVGGGKPALPPGVRIDLELADERRFASGTVYLRYLTRTRG